MTRFSPAPLLLKGSRLPQPKGPDVKGLAKTCRLTGRPGTPIAIY